MILRKYVNIVQYCHVQAYLMHILSFILQIKAEAYQCVFIQYTVTKTGFIGESFYTIMFRPAVFVSSSR